MYCFISTFGNNKQSTTQKNSEIKKKLFYFVLFCVQRICSHICIKIKYARVNVTYLFNNEIQNSFKKIIIF